MEFYKYVGPRPTMRMAWPTDDILTSTYRFAVRKSYDYRRLLVVIRIKMEFYKYGRALGPRPTMRMAWPTDDVLCKPYQYRFAVRKSYDYQVQKATCGHTTGGPSLLHILYDTRGLR